MLWPFKKTLLVKNSETYKTLAILGALCLFLSTIEYLIPKPMPFIRIGIANLPLMLAIDIFPLSTFVLLLTLKVVGQGLVTGTLFSYILLFSLAGTLFAGLLMYAIRRLLGGKYISFIGVGITGAMASNTAQLLLANILLFKGNIQYIVPPFLITGLITGLALGVFCELFSRRSQWYAAQKVR
jgi:heptaprenyl diphosphate synthase